MLGVTTKERVGAILDVPPLAEIGVPGYDAASWWMLVAPAKTPRSIVDKLHADLRVVLREPDVREEFIQRQGNGRCHHRDMPAGEIVERRLHALVGDMLHRDVEPHFEELAVEMLSGPRPGRAKRQSARGGTRQLDQVLDRTHRQRRVDQQNLG